MQELFRDTTFYTLYLTHLSRMAQPGYLNNFITSVDDEIDEKMQLLAEEFPLGSFSWEVLKNNQLYMRQWLYPHEALKAHVVELKEGVLTLEVGNRQGLPVHLYHAHSLTHSLLKGRSRWEQILFKQISAFQQTIVK